MRLDFFCLTSLIRGSFRNLQGGGPTSAEMFDCEPVQGLRKTQSVKERKQESASQSSGRKRYRVNTLGPSRAPSGIFLFFPPTHLSRIAFRDIPMHFRHFQVQLGQSIVHTALFRSKNDSLEREIPSLNGTPVAC